MQINAHLPEEVVTHIHRIYRPVNESLHISEW